MYTDGGKFHRNVAMVDCESRIHRSPSMSTGTQFGGGALVVDFLAQQGWGKLADGTIVWADDHRMTPTQGGRSGRDGTSTP